MKTYVINVRYYISTDDIGKALNDIGITDSEYYGGYEIVEVENDGE